MDATCTPKRSLTDCRRRSKSVPITPRDKSRLTLLRQDPSVASLLYHYDDEGHLNSALFSNTPSPQKDGGIQRRCTGSTLRQLLGHPSSPDLRNSIEGDISWAEKFLGSEPNPFSFPPETDEIISETDANSSVSSIGPQTPVDAHFTHTHSIDDNTTLSIECDTSATDHPTFSSLEVELSASTDYPDYPDPQTLDSHNGNSMTSQRASHIFGFLGDKKRAHDSPVSRLPQLKTTTPNYRRFSAEPSISDTKPSQIPLRRRSNIYILQPGSPTSERCLSLVSDSSQSPPSPIGAVSLSPQYNDEIPLSPSVIPHHTEQSGDGLRGPPLPSKIPSRLGAGPLPVPCDVNETHPVAEWSPPMQSALVKSNSEDKHSGAAVVRSREIYSQIPKLRTPSGSSSGSGEYITNSPRRHPLALQPGVQSKPRPIETGPPTSMIPHGKENDVLSRLPQPVTPMRPFGIHSHLRDLPSPASSSELSPVAKQMMANLRQQRMDARQRERQSGRLGSSQSRIRY